MALTPVQEAQVLDLIAQQSALLSLAGVEATILSKLGATKVTLSDLPTASVIDDADLLLLRQGVTDKSVTGLTFKNLIPSTITTPPQFDNDTSIANTEFVQRALGNRSSNIELTAATTLTAANAGNFINLSTNSFTVTLPVASTCPIGTEFVFHNDGLTCVIQRQGSDNIAVSGSNVNSITIGAGEFLVISGQSSIWRAYGSAVLKNEAQFTKSLAENGYQKLPSGFIMQWGVTLAVPNDGNTAVALPITFPTAAYIAQVSFRSGNITGAEGTESYNNLTTSSITLQNGTNSARDMTYFVIGN